MEAVEKRFKTEGISNLSNTELQKIEGGIGIILGAIGAIAGIVYLAGEIAEQAGKAYREQVLDKRLK